MKRIVLLVLVILFIFNLTALKGAEPFYLKKWQELGFCLKDYKVTNYYETFMGRDIYGEFLVCSSSKKISINDFIKILNSKKFNILNSSDTLIAKKNFKNNGITIWLKFNPNDSDSLKVINQKILTLNKEFTLNLEKDNDIYFYYNHPGDKYLILQVNHSKNVNLNFDIHSEYKFKKLKTTINYDKKLKSDFTLNHFLLDLPQIKGKYLVKLSVESNDKPCNIELKLIDEGEIASIPRGDKLGAILLKNVPYGNAKAIPEGDIYYSHPSFSEDNYVGDKTPDGSSIFWLTPGNWELKIQPEKETYLKEIHAHMIPVFPGYITEVDWPTSFSRIFEEDDAIKLEILKAYLDNKNSYVDISLLNIPKEQKTKLLPRNFNIVEAGSNAKVLKVELLKTPPEIVILLDSSGSMKRSMKKAIKATESFLKGLPQNSKVTLIDFDTKPKNLGTGSPNQILKKLKKIKANGATALYDSIIMGLSLLKNANRPTLIVFTDGYDANYNDTGPGSKATQEEVFEKAKELSVPIFTIGFGKKPDVGTLSRLASLTGAQYYKALDSIALNKVFENIKNNLGHQWRINFIRPKTGVVSDKPVIALMIDNSGSMEEEIEKVKYILRDFIKKLPEGFLVQLFIFSDNVEVKQVLTSNKIDLIRAISEMKDLSGTNILYSVESAYKFLHSIPSSNRYLFYLTDEALDVDSEDDRKNLNIFFQKLKDDGIKCLWVGMIEKDEKGVFKKAAKLSGGNFVIAPSPEKIRKALESLSKELVSPRDNNKHLLRVILKRKDKFGRSFLYSDAIEVDSPLPINKKMIKNPEAICWKKGEKIKPYSGEISKLVTGDDVIGKQVKVVKRIPLNVSAKNKAVEIKLKEAIFMSRFRGIDAPSGKRFLAITLSMKNILPPQDVVVFPDGSSHPSSWFSGSRGKNAKIVKKIPDYLIPDARLHIFLRWNNEENFPVSEATYLAETPLILPNETEIYIRPKKTITGTLIFMVPDNYMKQSSIHFYDVAYGHIDIPISGIIKIKKETIISLPKLAPKKLSDTFSMRIIGYKDSKEISKNSAEDNNIFRIVTCNFISKVQAHLSIRPKERFFLAIETNKGDYIFNLHPITSIVPYGFYEPRLVTPGSYNRMNFVFEIPEYLKEYPCKLIVDVKGGGVDIPIISKKIEKDFKKISLKDKAIGVNFYLNDFSFCKDCSNLPENTLILDVSIEDIKDDASTSLGADFITLKFTEEAKKRLNELYKSIKNKNENKGLGSFSVNFLSNRVGGDIYKIWGDDYLLSYGSEIIILNGKIRRFFIFFQLPKNTNPNDFKLVSSVFKNLNFKFPAKVKSFTNSNLITKKSEFELKDEFSDKVAQVLERLTNIRLARGFIKPGSINSPTATLDGKPPVGIKILPPSLVSAGGKKLNSIKTIKDLKKELKKLKVLPSNWEAWKVAYSPEAIFVQGWLTENEMAYLYEKLLSKQGIESKRKTVKLNQKGKEKIKKFFKNIECKLYELPALSFEDDKGGDHCIVFPFMRESWELKDLIEKIEENDSYDPYITVEVNVHAKKILAGEREVISNVSDALTGEEKNDIEVIELLSRKIKLKDASLDALDLGFAEVFDRSKGKTIKAVLDTPNGRIIGENALVLSKYKPIRIELKFYTPNKDFVTTRTLPENSSLTNYFFVIGANLPDLPEESMKFLNKKWQEKYKKSKNPNGISALRWTGRGVITRFVGAQTKFENNISKKLKINTIRLRNPRILVVTFDITANNKKPEITFDMVNPYPDVYGSEKAAKSFNALAGIFYTSLEGNILPDGINTFKIWRALPTDTKLILIGPDEKNNFIKILKEKKYPNWIIKHIEDTNNFILIPSKPFIKDKKAITAWLEINPNNYRVYSYLSTGERGVVDYITAEDIAELDFYLIGAWMGGLVSIWSVASFSLILDNYNDIKMCAFAFAFKIADNLNAVLNIQDTVKIDKGKLQKLYSEGLTSALGLNEINYNSCNSGIKKEIDDYIKSKGWTTKEIFESLKEFDLNKAKEKAKGKYLGFTNGFKDAVIWYFK